MSSEVSKKRLIEMLEKTVVAKRHYAYQILPTQLQHLQDDMTLEFSPKYEAERLSYMLSKVVFKDKSVLDIGCNTGYFLFEALEHGAKQCTGYEGEKVHWDFVSSAAEAIGEKRIHVANEYFIPTQHTEKYDIALLLNIVHHIGDDFDEKSLTMEQAKTHMITYINDMANITDTLIFQMGFNWQRRIDQCLFPHGTKAEMIDFIKQGTSHTWDIRGIGIPEKKDGKVKYNEVNSRNIKRDDSLGEFLNRPIFILTKK